MISKVAALVSSFHQTALSLLLSYVHAVFIGGVAMLQSFEEFLPTFSGVLRYS
jgi:hypothetical protein